MGRARQRRLERRYPHQVALRLDAETFERLQVLADRDELSVSAVARDALRRSLALPGGGKGRGS